MSDNSEIFQETELDSGSFNEWVEETARTTGTSKEELLEQLIAAYWRQSEVQDGDTVLQNEESPSGEDGVSTLNEDRVSTDADSKAVFDRLRDLHSQIDDLRERVEELEEESRDDEALQNLREAERVERLEAVDDAPTEEEFAALAKWVHSIQESAFERHRELRSRQDEEIDHLETILGYLIEMTDELDDHTEALQNQYRKQFEELRGQREQFVELKREANRLDVSEARCESCGTSVDLGILAEPACPSCQKTFDGIELGDTRLGFTVDETVLTTSDKPLPEHQSSDGNLS